MQLSILTISKHLQSKGKKGNVSNASLSIIIHDAITLTHTSAS